MNNTTTTCPTCQDDLANAYDAGFGACCGWTSELLDLCDMLPEGFRAHLRHDMSAVRRRVIMSFWVNDPRKSFAGTVRVAVDSPSGAVIGIALDTTAETKLAWNCQDSSSVQHVPMVLRVAAEWVSERFNDVIDTEGPQVAIATAVDDWREMLEPFQSGE